MKIIIALMILTTVSCSHRTHKHTQQKYCLGNVSHSFLNSFTRTGDLFLNEFLLDKFNQPGNDFKSVSNYNDDLTILKNKDAIPLFYKKYSMEEVNSDQDQNGSEMDTHTFVMFSEMKSVRREEFLKATKGNQKFCFLSDLPKKTDSYPGIEVFFAQDFEEVK